MSYLLLGFLVLIVKSDRAPIPVERITSLP